MAISRRQSTAGQVVTLGPFVSDTDGKTPQTALTITNTDIKLSVNGSTTFANKNSGGATHISGGIYHCTLDATDTATVGPLVLYVNFSGCLPVRLECEVLSQVQYDAKFGAVVPEPAGVGTLLARIPSVLTITSGKVTVGTNDDKTGYSLAANGLTAVTAWSVGITGNITGNLNGSVNSVAAGGIAAASIADGALTAAKFAANSLNGKGDWLLASGYTAPLDAAGVRAAIGLAAANLDAQLTGIPAAVWAVATRTLTAGTNISLAKGSGVTGFNDIAAADVWAVGSRTLTAFAFTVTAAPVTIDSIFASAMITAILDGISGEHGNGSYARNTEPPTAAAVATAVGAVTVDGTVTRIEKERLELAALAGKTSPDGSTYFAPDNVTPRLVVTENGDGRDVTRTP